YELYIYRVITLALYEENAATQWTVSARYVWSHAFSNVGTLRSSMRAKHPADSATFSSYKNHNTAKGLIGISASGYPSFVSSLYAGRTSDKKITKDRGILDLLEPGDQVMADRGFEIESDLPSGVTLNIPPFLDGKDQLSLEEELTTRKIASVRVHVERAIARIKNYRILHQVVPITLAKDLDKIWKIHILKFLVKNWLVNGG
ncbi:Hypothetical predicted protein, partial [Paramuricea clavata]